MTLSEKHWFKNLKSNDISNKSLQIIFSDSIAKTSTTRQSLLSKHKLTHEHNMSLTHTINCSYIFLILNLILCWHISHKVNDLCKNTTAIERTKLSNKILYFRIWHLKMINWLCQLQSNLWWSSLAQQLCQSLNQSILTLSKKSIFVVIKIDTNVLLEIDCNHSILSDHIMLWKILILMMKMSIMSIQIRFKIIRILILIKKN